MLSERWRLTLLRLGEGAFAGLTVGLLLGAWDVHLNRDLSRGMIWLAAERLAKPAWVIGIWGAAIPLLVDLLRTAGGRRLRRLSRALLATILGSSVIVAGAFLLRGRIFSFHPAGNSRITVVILWALLAVGGLLLIRSLAAGRGAAGAGPSEFPGGKNATGGRIRRSVRVAVAGAGIAGTILAAGFHLSLPRVAAARASGRPSVILVSLDTLRADRLGVMGYRRPLTPRLDDLGREGAVFEQAAATSPWTLPSHVSMFTSLLPFDHGVRRETDRIPPSRALVAEHFREAGYRTAGFSGGGYVSASFGFGQGFEVYEEHDESFGKSPEPIAAAALNWVRGVGKAPFFLFVHTYEVHAPYTHSDFANPQDAGRLPPAFRQQQMREIGRGALVLTQSERRYVSDLYDGDIADADRVMGGLLRTLRSEGILDRALLVVLSDHGEDLWDHDLRQSPRHGHTLYEEVIRVPLLVRAPGRIPAGARIRTPVSLLDLAPTLLAFAALAPDPSYRGRSLAGSLRTGSEPASLPVYSESVEDGPERFAVREGAFKVVITPLEGRGKEDADSMGSRPVEVYNLETDPLERHDLAGEMPAPAKRAARALGLRAGRALSLGSAGKTGEPDLPEELLRQLRSLGYVQ